MHRRQHRRRTGFRIVCVLALACVASACNRVEPEPIAPPAADVPVTVKHESPETPAPLAQVPAASPESKPTVTAGGALDAMLRAVELPQPLQSAACLAHTQTEKARPSVAVHRWVDANGITHYSDQAPVANVKDYRVIEVAGVAPILVQASGYDGDLPAELQQRAVADALGVQRVMHDTLGVPAPTGMTLKIVFVRSAENYARLVGEPALAGSVGAYSPADRTIRVHMQAQDEANFPVLRHEITHALVHESIGNLPISLNEGMAEYFGRYRTGGMGGTVDVGAERAGIVAAAPGGDGSEALVDLLSRDGSNFYTEDAAAAGERERRYLRAYSLVALLMRDREGQSALQAVLSAQSAAPCVPVTAEAILQRSYAGGLRKLAGDWTEFMRNPPRDVRAY
jgi:hypothetical protein